MLYYVTGQNYFVGYPLFKLVIIIFFKPGHFPQPRSICFNLDQFGASKNSGHMPQVTGHCFSIIIESILNIH